MAKCIIYIFRDFTNLNLVKFVSTIGKHPLTRGALLYLNENIAYSLISVDR